MKQNWLIFLVLLICFQFSAAKVISITIEKRDTILNGKNFGQAGAYELIKGKVFFGTNPLIAQNLMITDLKYAPINENGLVLSSGDIEILKPIDNSKTSTALVEVSNRGGKFIPSYFLNGNGRLLDPEITSHYGDGLLMEEGVTIIWLGWQFDIPEQKDLLNFIAPVAKYPEGTPIIGQVRSDWTLDQTVVNLSLGHRTQIGYPVYDPQSDIHVLTKRSGRNATREIVSREQWDFGRWEAGELIRDDRSIYSKKGFEAGMIYELVYYSADPPLVGLGLSAVRDIISYAKYELDAICPVKFGIAAGVSQTGRFLRQFLYQGFNIDESGRRAFDGMMIITAGAGRGSFNHRFAQPSRDAHRYSAFFYPTDIFPFSGGMQIDPETKKQDGILAHLPSDFQPKIFSINTGYEYWGRSASLIHTSIDGTLDFLPQPNERIYQLSSGQHYVDAFPPGEGEDVYVGNPLEFRPNYRALFIDLLYWVRDNKLPPDSKYPQIKDGNLVRPNSVKYPIVKSFIPATEPQMPYRVDYGPKWTEGIITNQPPKLGDPYPVLVPQVDKYGNEIGGIRNAEIEVPLATYVPYSLRKNLPGGNGEIADFRGTFIPLPVEKDLQDDSRSPITELYKNKADYLVQVRTYLEKMVKDQFLLSRDIHRILEKSRDYWNWIIPAQKSDQEQVKILSFNIRYDNPGDGASRWDARKEQVYSVIQNAAPDFFGMQEAVEHQCKDVERGTKGYRWIGVGREDGKEKGEFSPLFYDRKKWKLLEWNTFWLSETPDIPSKGWDAAFERIVTWGKFEQKGSGKIIFVFNTHFDHRGIEARINSANLIRNKIREIAGGNSFLLSGDFNVNPGTEAYLTLTSPEHSPTIFDSKIMTNHTPEGPAGTFSGFLVTENLPLDQIDYIFCSQDLDVDQFNTIVKSDGQRYASDHFAVEAIIRLD